MTPMHMTEWEIRRDYNAARNKRAQLRILADMNECKVMDIKQVLGLTDKKKEVKE